MLDHYRMFADYNRWANRLLYQAAAALTDAEYREDRGAFFGSLASRRSTTCLPPTASG